MKKNWKYAAAAVLIPFVALVALSFAMLVLVSLAAPTKLDGQTRSVPAVMTKVTHDIRYETPCGIIAHILRRCDDTEAFVAELRTFDGHVLQEVSEGDVGSQVVLVFKATGPGTTTISFALTRGERSKAYESRRYVVTVP